MNGREDGPEDERVRSPRRAIAELVAVVAAVVVLSFATGAEYAVLFIACLIVMVMVHEAGHLLTAKRGGMKVTEYFLGFGPRLWSFRRGETEYGVKAFPLGGYVRIPGMTNLDAVAPEDEDRAYRNRPFPARLSVALAGSAMHFLMAFVLACVLFAVVGVPQTDRLAVGGLVTVTGTANPARAAGLRPGDVVVAVNGKPVNGDPDRFSAAVRSSAGRPMTVVVNRNHHDVTLEVTPVNGRKFHEAGVTPPAGTVPYGVVGVELTNPTATAGPVSAVAQAGRAVASITWASIVGVAHLFSPAGIAARFQQASSAKAASQAVTDGTRVNSVYGVVGIGADAARAGPGDLLLILIAINLFVGVFNLFPMLPLDGGHVAIAVYERIRSARRRVAYHADVAKLLPLTYLMVTFLVVLFATALLTDILHPVANPFQ